MPCPSNLTPGNDPVPTVWKLGEPQGQSDEVQKIFPHKDLIPTAKPIASHYTNYAIPTHL